MKDTKSHNLPLFLAAPILHCGASGGWLPTLLLGGGAIAVSWWMKRYLLEPGKGLKAIQGLWLCILISQMLRWTAGYWPDHGSAVPAPLILLALVLWLCSRGKEPAGYACRVLWIPVIALLGMVLISGVTEINIEHLKPKREIGDVGIAALLILAAMESGGRNQGTVRTVILWLLACAAGAVTIAAVPWAQREAAPLYALSRSVQFLGVGRRLESITAVAMTLGMFCAIAALLRERAEENLWYWGISIALLYISGFGLSGKAMSVGTILIWLIFPAITSLFKISKKS